MLFVALLATLNTYERNCAERIFEEHNKLIYEIAYKILNKKEDAEDILDEVMINVIKNIEKFVHANRNEIEAQLVVYSRNAAINLYNRNKRQSKLIQAMTYVNDDGELEDIDIADADADIDAKLLSEETAELVKRSLNKLPAKLRDTVELVYGMGYSNVEAARVLGTTPNTVGLRLLRAKRKLLEIVEGEFNERI